MLNRNQLNAQNFHLVIWTKAIQTVNMKSDGFERAAECFKLLFSPLIAVSVVGLLVDNFLEVNCTRAVLVACSAFSAVKS